MWLSSFAFLWIIFVFINDLNLDGDDKDSNGHDFVV